MPVKIIYECDTCGRFELKPLSPNHFHPDVHKGVCGHPTVAREYKRVETLETLAEELRGKVKAA